MPLERLAGRWHTNGSSDEQDVKTDASLLMSGYPTYQAIEWVDPKFHVLWVAPENGNEAEIGADLSTVPGLPATLEDAARNNRTMVAPHVDLRQGGRGSWFAYPCTRGKNSAVF